MPRRSVGRLAALLLALSPLSAAAPASAQDTPAAVAPADQAAIQSVIRGQIGAFRRDDGAAAFGFASPGIRAQFGDAANFMRMVRQGYAPVYHPQSFAFGALTQEDGRTVQRVELTAPNGDQNLALYFMEREPDGSWRIDGCELLPSQSVGA
jgi:hypothetical protein